VVYGLLALFAKTTPIEGKRESCLPSEESNTRWFLHLPNVLPRKKGRLPRLRNHFFFFFHSIFYGEYLN
jgi:hypothetical protein